MFKKYGISSLTNQIIQQQAQRNLPLCLFAISAWLPANRSADEIGALGAFGCGGTDARSAGGFDAPHQPRHLAGKVAHRLQPLPILQDVRGTVSVYHAPVRRADGQHP